MSQHPRPARFSRLDPANWPSGLGTAIFIGWVVYAVACAVWLHMLLWTVLPSGLTLYLFGERYPWRIIALFVAPLALLTVVAQVVATWSEVPTWAAFAIYFAACASFSLVICIPNRDRWIGRLPARLLGARFDARLAWARFEESLLAANTELRRIDASDDQSGRRAALDRLVRTARGEARRGGAWHDAWAAQETWLTGVEDLVGTEPSADQARHVHDLLVDLDGAHMLAIERTSVLDPPP